MKAFHTLMLAMGSLFFLSGCVAPRETPESRDGDRRISVLYTHGIKGQLEPCG